MNEYACKTRRVVIVGGTGVFGSRLARLLVRDGHDVLIAARGTRRAEALASEIGARALTLDAGGDLSALERARPDVIVDAAGPFQTYDEAPYRLARLAISIGADYIDLADDARFCSGIGALDGAARAAGCRVISGASSVPGLSSAVVASLVEGLDAVELIESAIMPGNKAPRGASVIHAILAQVGERCRAWRGGRWMDQRVWSSRRRYELAAGDRRTVYNIPVPDTVLFPEYFAARSVIFRAGMEVGLLNWGLSVIAWIKRMRLAPPVRWLVRPSLWGANLVRPFGTDRGGMIVDVTGRRGGTLVRRRWRLVAEGGDGPFVPTVTARALLSGREAPLSGARPCLGEVPLDVLEAQMRDLDIATSRSETTFEPLFARALGARWSQLADPIRDLHCVVDREIYTGDAHVTCGRSVRARVIAWLFGFPLAGELVPVTVTITREGDGEVWERNFSGRRFRSRLTYAGKDLVYERFGPFTFELRLDVDDGGGLVMAVRRGWLMGVPLHNALLPASNAREMVDEAGGFVFDVPIEAPLGTGLVVHYRGSLAGARAPQQDLVA